MGNDGRFKPRHGKTGTRVYMCWESMLRRCSRPKDARWPNYGARGITVCEDWRTFENFYADMGDPPDRMSLHRIDNDGPYCKQNCRWATWKEQERHRRNNRLVSCDGLTLTVAEWSERSGIQKSTLTYRLDGGWDAEIAIKTPVRPWKRAERAEFMASFERHPKLAGAGQSDFPPPVKQGIKAASFERKGARR